MLKRCLFLLPFAFCALSQSVPQAMNYQGRLTDGNGQPITGTRKLEFNVYTAAAGGSLLWGPQVFDNVEFTSAGEFNVILGQKDASNRDLSIAFASSNAFLGVKVGPTGGTVGSEISPRQQILSAPFSMVAARAVEAPLPKVQHLSTSGYSASHGGPSQVITGLQTSNFPIRKGSWLRARMTLAVEKAIADPMNSTWAIYLSNTPIGPTVSLYDVGITATLSPGLKNSVVIERMIDPATLGNTAADKTVSVSGRCESTGGNPLTISLGNGTLELEEVLATQVVQP